MTGQERFHYRTPDEYGQWWAENAPDGVEYGFCWCGCGGKTSVSRDSDKTHGYVSGEPNRFINHHCLAMCGERSPSWTGGKHSSRGYTYIRQPWHPFSNPDGYIAEHRVVMEDELCRYLWPWEHVHHANEVRDDNRPENLMVMTCSEHMKHHRKMDLFGEGDR